MGIAQILRLTKQYGDCNNLIYMFYVFTILSYRSKSLYTVSSINLPEWLFCLVLLVIFLTILICPVVGYPDVRHH